MEDKKPDTTRLIIITAIISFLMTSGFIYFAMKMDKRAPQTTGSSKDNK